MKRTFLFIALALFYLVSFGQAKATSNQGKPLIIGEVDEIQSAILSEKRILNIYLPDGYNANDTTTYPAVYLLDGGTDEDFIHITGLYQFNSFPGSIAWRHPSLLVLLTRTENVT